MGLLIGGVRAGLPAGMLGSTSHHYFNKRKRRMNPVA